MNSKGNCQACGGLGWWCCGCGGQTKMKAMKEAGYTYAQAEAIYYKQFGSCGDFYPCVLCNPEGTGKPL